MGYNCKCRVENIPYPKRTDQKQTSTFVEVKMQYHHKGQNDLLITEIECHKHGSTETKVTAKICLQTDNNNDRQIP
jgi:hypothetical protein